MDLQAAGSASRCLDAEDQGASLLHALNSILRAKPPLGGGADASVAGRRTRAEQVSNAFFSRGRFEHTKAVDGQAAVGREVLLRAAER